MTEDEAVLARLLNECGYLVCNVARKYRLGEKIDGLDHDQGFRQQPFVVIGEATKAEAEQQELNFGEVPEDFVWAYPYFYRVSTD